MTAKEFVKTHYPNAESFPMIDNERRQTSYVIIKGNGGLSIFENNGSTTANNAWVNAKKEIISQLNESK